MSSPNPDRRRVDPGRSVPRVPDDTIAAIATPPGEGAIGIVRLSGPDAVAIVTRIFRSPGGRSIAPGQKRVYYGHILDGSEEVDEVLVHIMRAPHSYTCEDVVEINCHGGPAPLRAVLELVLAQGARLATPGEFTKRAFLNGRIDLVQAEAVIDRIRAQTRACLRAASAAASGTLSKSLYALRETLVHAASQIEAAIDFPDEEIPEQINAVLRGGIESARNAMLDLLSTAEAGRLYREGASIAIAGRPNVGKSSLFNALLRDARAIVTAIPGTTRDLLEEVVNIQGIPVRLADTAGLHDTSDEVERIGIERARIALQNADAAILVLDATVPLDDADHAIADELKELDVPIVIAVNKIDLAPQPPSIDPGIPGTQRCVVSAMTGEGLAALEAALATLLLKDHAIAPDHGLITRTHQCDSLRRAVDALQRLLDNFDASPEFLSIELYEALSAIGEITGETTPDDLLEIIFSSFCIGK